jgi:Capsule polysaccharide biosynthesis protein
MKVVVFTAYTRWTFHYATELEIMQRHLDDNDQVVQLYCDSALLACDVNPEHHANKCQECIGIRKNGLALLSPGVKSIPFLHLTRQDRHELAELRKHFDSIDELRSYRFDNFDVGYAVLSSIITWTRDPQVDLHVHDDLIARFVVSGFSVYRSMQNYLRQNQTDRVYVFNGRIVHARAVLRACQSMGIPCFLHERGHDLKHYGLFENAMPHEIDYIESEIRDKWIRDEENPDRQEIAEKFFVDRSKGIIGSWFSFTDTQLVGRLPTTWDTTKRNIAIFNSSEDEFASIGDEYINPLYASQQEGLERIIKSLATSSDNIHLYLRIHPNLKEVDNSQTRALARLKADRLTVIPADDPVCTYTLMRNADKILTFGSTVGIEAVYWNKPSVLAGPTYYRNLGGTYNPSSHDELISLLHADLPPMDKTAALMYGYYCNSAGIPFKYYEPLDVIEGKFKGEKPRAKPTPLRVMGTIGARIHPLRRIARRMFILRTLWRVTGSFRLS